MSACLPIWRRISQPASAEPTASPSGRACEVTTNRSRRSISAKTWFNIVSLLFFCALQQFVNPGFVVLRTVQQKHQLRSSPQVQPVGDFMADVSRCRTQPFQAALPFFFTTLHHHEYSRRARVLCQLNRGYANQPDAWISELALHQCFNFFPQGLA